MFDVIVFPVWNTKIKLIFICSEKNPLKTRLQVRWFESSFSDAQMSQPTTFFPLVIFVNKESFDLAKSFIFSHSASRVKDGHWKQGPSRETRIPDRLKW
jgi:hypothetical protein